MRPASTAFFLTMILGACVGKSDPASHMNPQRESAPKAEKPPSAPAEKPKPAFVKAQSGDAAGAVEAAITAAGPERKVLVYVGAEWCEPCTRFHEAVEAGELDEALEGVRFVEFDSDHDRDRLAAGGYDGKLIPRFVVPTPDGTPSDQRIEGGIKGEGAVEHIMTRLAPLLSVNSGVNSGT